MNKSAVVIGAALLGLSTAAWANDTTAQLSTGGLVFVTNESIEMASEELSVSPTQVQVVYQFNNTSDQAQHILVAFPMPDIAGSGDFMTAVPVNDGEGQPGAGIADKDNLFGFKTLFNGTPVKAVLHQYAFQNNIDYSETLRKLGLPLEPFGQATYDGLNALSRQAADRLVRLGLIFRQEYDAGNGLQVDNTPVWTLRSTYSWEATFPPGRSEVVHSYVPSVGGTVSTTFMPQENDEYSAQRMTDYKARYCVDDDLIRTLKKFAVPGEGYTGYPYTESWISYVWSTGGNWSGPIGTFTLTVDKGKADSLVSFCGDGVKKIGPTTFRMTATDWYPPDHELEILILNKDNFQ